jgi:hypothetical protein
MRENIRNPAKMCARILQKLQGLKKKKNCGDLDAGSDYPPPLCLSYQQQAGGASQIPPKDRGGSYSKLGLELLKFSNMGYILCMYIMYIVCTHK